MAAMKRFFVRAVLAVLVVLGGATLPVRAQRPVISTKPDTPFKLATFEAAGKVRVGLVLGAKVIDIESAHALLIQELALRGAPAMPRDMRTLIETYADVAPHLYRIANYFSSTKLDAPFVYDVQKIAIKAPIKYPYNILAIAANYKLHAGEMFPPGSCGPAATPYMCT